MNTLAYLKSQVDAVFPTNGTKSITAASHRSFLKNMLDGIFTPAGTVRIWAGFRTTIPTGWHLCDGTALDQTTYSDLYTALGGALSPYGVGATTFNLPNIPAFANIIQTGITNGNENLAATGGEKEHTLTIPEMPSHTHIQNPHTHQFRIFQDAGGWNSSAWTNGGVPNMSNSLLMTSLSETATNQNTGGGTAHNNMPPYIAMNYIIKII